MEDLKKKRKIAYVLTLVTLANIWASIACEIPNIYSRGAIAVVTVVLIGITIERWARFLKAYINYEIEQKIKKED
jgi:hypothetical protein